MSDDFDDLMETPRKRGRPTKAEQEAKRAAALDDAARQALIRRAGAGDSLLTVEDFDMPVSKNWLARLMHMDPMTATKRLRDCPVAGKVGHNREVYYFHEALPYLVKPKMTAKQFAESLNKADLPPEINNTFWQAQRARVRYKIEAQEAFESEDVVRLLGEVAITLKDSLTMAPEELRNRAKLSEEQIVIVEGMLDEMRQEMHDRLIRIPAETMTPSLYDKPMFGVSGEVDRGQVIPDEFFDEDDE